MILLSFLLVGCGAWTDLPKEITGPSWDTVVEAPLIPPHKLKIGELIKPFLDLPEDEEDGVITITDELPGMDPLYPLEGIDLSDFTASIPPQTINIENLIQNITDNVLDGLRFSQNFQIPGYNFDLSAFNFTDSLDVPELDENTLDTILNSFEMDEPLFFLLDPETKYEQERLEGIEIIDSFEDFTSITFKQGTLDLTLTNDTNTTVTDLEIFLYNEGQEVLHYELPYSLTHGEDHDFQMKLDDKELTGEIEFIVTLSTQEATPQFPAISNLLLDVEFSNMNIDQAVSNDGFDFNTSVQKQGPLVPDINTIQFQSGTLSVDIDFDERLEIEDDDFTLSIKIGDVEFTGTGNHDLTDKTLNLQEHLDVEFSLQSNTYAPGAKIDFNISLEDTVIKEVQLKDPIELNYSHEIELTGLENHFKEIEFASGLLTVDLEDDLGLDLSLNLAIDGQNIDLVEGTTNQYDFKGLHLIMEEEKPLVLEFDVGVTAHTYKPDATIVIETSFKDLSIEKAVLTDPLDINVTETIQPKELLGEMSSFLHRILFKSGDITILFDDGDLDMDIEINAYLGEDPLPIQREDKTFILDLEDFELRLEDDLDFIFEFSLLANTYRRGGEVTFGAEMGNFDWKEMDITLDLEELDIDLPSLPEQTLEVGLDEFPDFLHALSIDRDYFNLNLILDNGTPLEIRLEDLELKALDGEGNVLESETLSFYIEANSEYNVGEPEHGHIDALLRIFESFPHSIYFGGGTIDIGPPGGEDYVTITKDLFVGFSGNYSLGLSLILSEEGAFYELDPFEVEVDLEDLGDVAAWIRKGTLFLEMENATPLGLGATLFLGRDENTLFDEGGADFSLSLGLPETTRDSGGNIIPATETYTVELDAEILKLLKEELYAGMRFELLNTSGEAKTMTFRSSDYIRPKAWVRLEVRINPKDEE